MDFGRLPGESLPGASHLNRFALNEPLSGLLSHAEKRNVLQECFDETSRTFERYVSNKLLKIAIHSYDTHNEAGTPRPLVSLIYQPVGYHHTGRIPFDVFDRMYPDHLAEFTADRRLVARISLELEKKGITVGYNHPYQLPEGSVEFRSQVWFFFNFLRERFIEASPQRRGDPDYDAIFEMLMDTNLRSTTSATLRSYLHLFRRVEAEDVERYRRMRHAYEDIECFMIREQIARQYRMSPDRPSSLAIEVRKDYVWRFEDAYCRVPVLGLEGALWNNIERITDELARAIRIYFKNDRTSVPIEIPEGRL